MSYRMYIASHSKQTTWEKNQIFRNVILPNMLKHKTEDEYFIPEKLCNAFGCTLEMELGKDDLAMSLLPKCPPYLPKETCKAYPDYLPQDNQDANYIGLLTKDLLLDYIKDLHQYQISLLKRHLEDTKTNRTEALENAIFFLSNQIVNWECSLTFLNEKSQPYIVTNSIIYHIYQLCQLLINTDFNKTDLILYGW